MEHDILIDEEGAHFVYADELAEVFAGEPQETKRASHVEPSENGKRGWTADMRPSGGPVLFESTSPSAAYDVALTPSDPHKIPFTTRQQALDAERTWLREHKGL